MEKQKTDQKTADTPVEIGFKAMFIRPSTHYALKNMAARLDMTFDELQLWFIEHAEVLED